MPGWAGIPDLDVAGPTLVAAYFRTYGPTIPERVPRTALDRESVALATFLNRPLHLAVELNRVGQDPAE